MVRSTALVGAILLAGCASVPTAPVTQERFTRPAVGEVSTREVGEPLFEAEVATRFPGIRLTPGQVVPGPFGSKITFSAEELPRVSEGKEPQYCGAGTMQPVMGLPQPGSFLCTTEAQLRKSGITYSAGMITRNDPTNLRQQLLYQGRSGTSLKLSYREFTGDLARPAFTQDLTFDLADDPIIGAKGARVEVLEATNTSIRYRLIQGFAPSSR